MDTAWVTYLDEVANLDSMRATKQRITSLLDLHPGDSVLDAGCGTGDDARAMAALVAPDGQVTGLDEDSAILEEARRRSEGSGLPVTFAPGDVQKLHFPDAYVYPLPVGAHVPARRRSACGHAGAGPGALPGWIACRLRYRLGDADH